MMQRDAAAWRDLATFLGLSPAEAEGIGQAAVDPAAFAAAHPEAASERLWGEEEEAEERAPGTLALLSLVDALLERNFAIEQDWKDDWSEVSWSLGRMCSARGLSPDLPEHLEGTPDETFVGAAASLAAVGAVLWGIDIDSDSYVATLLPLARGADAEALAARTGIEAQWWD